MVTDADYDLIQAHYTSACMIALDITERRARKILQEHPELDEFIMAMGAWFFTTKDGEHVYGDDERVEPVYELLDNWDEYLRITGNPVRFTARGERITDW